MRALTLAILALAAVSGCIDGPPAPTLPSTPPGGTIAGKGTDESKTDSPSTTNPKTTDPISAKPTLEVLQEEVYVLMKDYDGGDWLCTGTLVSKDRVVTAGHCLDSKMFASYLVVAPLAPGKPRVTASNPTPMSDDFEDVENPDIGFLTLDEPIELPAYGILTDVTDQVDKGASLAATAVVRTAEELEAPFHAVDGLTIESTTDEGYEHGFGVKLFSHGGDSGAGMFLVENGHATHKIVGVCRQPDPDTNTDELTRVDGDFLAWFRENAGE
jgi:hypothetical protein